MAIRLQSCATASAFASGRYYCIKMSSAHFSTRLHQSYCKKVTVKNASMNYVDTGGNFNRTVIFLHGNPTSSYLWRNIYPNVSAIARCLAPDLIGMGHSDKVKNMKYTFSEHFDYLSEWMEKVVETDKVNLVVQDWGSVLGFHWGNLNQNRVESIIHMESFVAPIESWDKFPGEEKTMFQALRSPAGEEMVLQKNFFIEGLLPKGILRKLTEEEMNEYRKPFINAGEDRRPTLTWPREIPVRSDGPENVVAIADSYSKWLSQSADLPKLLISAEPGFFSSNIEKFTKNWLNHVRITVRGHHFLQEDSPREIGTAIHAFLKDKVFAPAHKL